jgi:hypothetical protein
LQWLKEDAGDPGYQVMTGRIVEEVRASDKADEEIDDDDDDEEEEEPQGCKIRSSQLRFHLDKLIVFTISSSDAEVKPYHSHFRAQRDYYS